VHFFPGSLSFPFPVALQDFRFMALISSVYLPESTIMKKVFYGPSAKTCSIPFIVCSEKGDLSINNRARR
jgi:hypothetical protein